MGRAERVDGVVPDVVAQMHWRLREDLRRGYVANSERRLSSLAPHFPRSRTEPRSCIVPSQKKA